MLLTVKRLLDLCSVKIVCVRVLNNIQPTTLRFTLVQHNTILCIALCSQIQQKLSIRLNTPSTVLIYFRFLHALTKGCWKLLLLQGGHWCIKQPWPLALLSILLPFQRAECALLVIVCYFVVFMSLEKTSVQIEPHGRPQPGKAYPW